MRYPLLFVCFLASASPVFAIETGVAADAAVADTANAEAAPAMADDQAQAITVTASRLNAARAAIQPEVGASLYSFDSTAIEALPGGRNVQLNQVLLRAPGVVQDSFGQIHIRGDHNGIQYRINGVILPEGLNVFGQSISPRFADKISLITGTLPAQYGLRSAGVVNIATRGSGFDAGGSASIYGGSHGQIQPSLEYSGSSGANSYFVSGSYLHNGLGIESADSSRTPLHDKTDQFTGFGYFDHILNDSSKLSVIMGSSVQHFQIPNQRGRSADLGLDINGRTDFTSDDVNDRQTEATHYGIVSYLYTAARFTGQLSLFGRYSSLRYTPDADLADLAFSGISQAAYKRNVAFGVQAEGKYDLSDTHTLRAGLVFQRDRSHSDTQSVVLPVDANGVQLVGSTPFTIADFGSTTALTYSGYLQDEWKPIEALVVNFGLRFDRFQGFRTEQQLSPRLNFVLMPVDGTVIHGGYARYFSPPPFELVSNTSVGKFVGTTAQFPGTVTTTPFAERSNYYDIGMTQKIGRVTLGVDLYLRTIRNMLDEGQFGAPIILTPFNYAQGRSRGVEFTANYQHGPITAYANLALAKVQGRNIISSQSSISPEDLAYIATNYIYVDHNQTLSASGGVAWSRDGTKLAVDGIFGSGLRSDGAVPNGGELPSYAIFNLAASHDFTLPAVGEIELRFDIVNLLDHQYQIRDGSGVGVGAPQYGARRGFFVGISKQF
jgi:outer membrane receptor for ferrienterochelin and colicins